MKYLLIDERMRKVEKEKLQNLGYKLVEITRSIDIYEEISAHVDIFISKIGKKLIVEPSKYDKIKAELPDLDIIQGESNIDSEYPDDIKYNVCIIGKKAIHNFQYTDTEVKKELIKQGYELVNTTQGYTNCSIAVIDEKSAIVTDKGLYKILEKQGIDVLYLEDEPDIKLLQREKYSNKKGFIGGSISRVENNIIIFGDLRKIDKDNKIRNFILKRNLQIIEFKNEDIVDYGGIIAIEKS